MKEWLIRMAATLDGDVRRCLSESALYPAGRIHAIAQQAGTRRAAPSPAKRARYPDGRLAHDLPERTTESARAIESDVEADVSHGTFSLAQTRVGTADATSRMNLCLP